MTYWGWRLLVIGLVTSVLVVACNTTGNATPSTSPTKLPPLTLIVRSPQARTPIPTAGLPLNATIQTAETLPIQLDAPTCYQQADNSVLCLGSIRNTSATATVGQVVFDARWVDTSGHVLEQTTQTVLQQIIPPQGNAPYHVRFETLYTTESAITLVPRRADSVDITPLPLTITEDHGRWVDGRYVISGRLTNTTTSDAHDIHIVATLRDSGRRVVGYRIHTIPTLPPQTTHPFTIPISPQVTDERVTYTLFVDAKAESPPE